MTSCGFVPGPDFPEGGTIVGLDGIREAYATGRGSFRTRATTRSRSSPAQDGHRCHRTAPSRRGREGRGEIKDLGLRQEAHRDQAISSDLTDRKNGTRLVVEIKNGFNPRPSAQLHRLTPMEDSFGINNVALVGGQPRTLGLKELLQVFVDFRIEVVRRRTGIPARAPGGTPPSRRGPPHPRHPSTSTRSSSSSPRTTRAMARGRLMSVFDLTQAQADYILEPPAAAPDEVLADRVGGRTRQAPARDRRAAGPARGRGPPRLWSRPNSRTLPRRTGLRDAPSCWNPPAPAAASTPLEVTDDPCWVLLSSTGLLARTSSAESVPAEGPRAA